MRFDGPEFRWTTFVSNKKQLLNDNRSRKIFHYPQILWDSNLRLNRFVFSQRTLILNNNFLKFSSDNVAVIKIRINKVFITLRQVQQQRLVITLEQLMIAEVGRDFLSARSRARFSFRLSLCYVLGELLITNLILVESDNDDDESRIASLLSLHSLSNGWSNILC